MLSSLMGVPCLEGRGFDRIHLLGEDSKSALSEQLIESQEDILKVVLLLHVMNFSAIYSACAAYHASPAGQVGSTFLSLVSRHRGSDNLASRRSGGPAGHGLL